MERDWTSRKALIELSFPEGAQYFQIHVFSYFLKMTHITEQTTLKPWDGRTFKYRVVMYCFYLTPQTSRKYVAKAGKGFTNKLTLTTVELSAAGNKRYDRNDKVMITSLLFLLRTRNMTRTGFISGGPCENATCV